ncbi:MAG: hypothetical protein AUG06_03370 [Actinobacteria bacterium 13_1_20CM_2_65_11]|nr:MAG: hypothetical protein AUH40_00315 [Chloroflexi bacterium 13_1_40CM_65_17]OLC68979.1 MAG: hypothetical protein AUH69_00220 [Actinobacteria bacterium 13_1_40CM_4_65_12]OLD25013.1 MAG: hypothetical protein AUJ02_06340 [Chloroflexi bacterium 13_1_40CM_3_65_12]OLD48880.1 MAG: hypothetical protein AUI42_10385 [Actinobacteria bacterium 13_1_40CM_2_65_8]OLE80826.1 MAG: hypothetical protein AUG06_03370 [Actinobacteria bacterium 13_1_20CM_2_65_11]
MSQDPAAQSVGQISADGQFRWDGQQWVPLAANYREPTPWTRPMQLISAALFALSAVTSVITTAVFVNHDTMVRALRAQNIPLQGGTTIDDVANFSLAITWAVVIFFTVCEVVAAIGSYLGWRWVFWAALVLYGLSGISAVTNLGTLSNASRSPVPAGGLIAGELFSVLGLAMFVWMLIAVIRYGPWAMKRPGR